MREMNAKEDIFQSMNTNPVVKEGKKYFTGKVNISDPENMHSVEKNPRKLAEYNADKMQLDYPDKSNIVY
jgi:hypothetical protein